MQIVIDISEEIYISCKNPTALLGIKFISDCLPGYGEIIAAIGSGVPLTNNQPSVQPERKTGHWIPVGSYEAFGGDYEAWMVRGNPIAYYYCSECKNQAYVNDIGEDILSDYCPDCGSYMGGGE